MNLSTGIIFGLIAMIGFGLSNAMSQTPSRKIGSRRTILFRNIFVSILLLITLLFFLKDSSFDLKYILIAFSISFIGYIPLATFLKGLKVGKVGIVSPIANSSVIFTVILSIVFFNESLSPEQIASIILIVIGIILISLNFKDLKKSNLFKISSGIPYALTSCFLWGIVFFLFKIPVTVLGPILTSFIIEFGILIFNAISLKISKISFSIPEKKTLLHILIIAFFGTLGTLFFNLGIAVSDVSIVAAITFSSPLVAVLYGKFVYKEKLEIQQWIAIAVILVGVLAVSYL